MEQSEHPELDEEIVTEEPSEEPSEPQEPVMVAKRVNGQTIMMTEAQADAWDAREVDFQRRLSQQGEELGRLRQARQEPARQPSPEDPNEANLRFFTDPNKALEERLSQERQKLEKAMREEMALDKERERFWGQFYSENKHLVGRDRFVQAIVAQEFDTLKDLPPDQSRKELAKIINGMLGVETKGQKRTLSDQPAMTERSTSSPNARSQPSQPRQPLGSVSAELDRRREARRRAAHKLPKD